MSSCCEGTPTAHMCDRCVPFVLRVLETSMCAYRQVTRVSCSTLYSLLLVVLLLGGQLRVRLLLPLLGTSRVPGWPEEEVAIESATWGR